MADIYLEEVWSGGQVGADIAGLRAAHALGLKTGGWIPSGFRTHDGPRPEYAELYALVETGTTRYPERTNRNVRDCDATFILGDNQDSSGCTLTRHFCDNLEKPYFTATIAEMNAEGSVGAAAHWLLDHRVQRLNVAGNRDAHEGVVEQWLWMVFQLAVRD